MVFLPNSKRRFVPKYQNIFACTVFGSKTEKKLIQLWHANAVCLEEPPPKSTAIQDQNFCAQMSSVWSFVICTVPARLGHTSEQGIKSPMWRTLSEIQNEVLWSPGNWGAPWSLFLPQAMRFARICACMAKFGILRIWKCCDLPLKVVLVHQCPLGSCEMS